MKKKLEAREKRKFKTARRNVSQLLELQKGVIKKMPKKYNKMPIHEDLETAKQRLKSLASHLQRYTRELEARRINQMFSNEPSKVSTGEQYDNCPTKAGDRLILA